MAGCEDCFFGGKKISYKGDIKSPFVIVGESPGVMELAKGKPFVGPSGALLDDAIAPFRAALPCEPLVTNALNCLPRQKDPHKLATACQRCSYRLVEEVKAHPRKAILALGNAALWSLTGKYGLKITQERGKVFQTSLAEKGIIAAVHPAFLLRGGGSLQQFKRDVSMAVSLCVGETLSAGPSTENNKMCVAGTFKPSPYKVLETLKDVTALVKELEKVKYAAADTETTGFNSREDKILCMGISFEKDMTYVIPGELITPALFDNGVKWCWHNGKFDIGFYRARSIAARVDDDTMLMSYLLNERAGVHDLEQVGGDWLQAPNYKNMLEKHLPSKKHSYEVIPKDVLYKYQAIDANLTFHLRDVLRTRIDADKYLKKVYTKILIPGSEFLHRVETDGFYVDLDAVEENISRLGEEADRCEKEFEAIAANYKCPGINIRSPIQVADLLYSKLKLGPTSWGTDVETLDKLPAHPAVKALREYRKVHKLLSTFVLPIKDKTERDGRLHTTFKLHGTTTGRLSSNKPNMQNIPRDPKIRGQFVAPKGRAIIEADLSQAELRMLACLSQDKNLCDIYLEGKQGLHDRVAIRLFGDNFTKDDKVKAKAVNFGIVYGITAPSLAEKFHVAVSEADRWIREWFQEFPQAHEYLMKCREAPIRGQTIISAFGRKRRFGVVTRERLNGLQNEAANFPEQSGASDITLCAGIELQPILRAEHDCKIVNTVHDCLVNELPDDMSIIVEAARKIVDTMVRIPVDWGLTEVPFEAEVEVGYRWGNCKPIHLHDFDNINLKSLKGVTYDQYSKKAAA